MMRGRHPGGTSGGVPLAAAAAAAAALLAAACADLAIEPPGPNPPPFVPASTTIALAGVPISGYPSYDERLMFTAMNRSRTDPNNPAAGTADACSTVMPAVPPLVYDFDASQSARFHCLNSTLNMGGLTHDSYCNIRTDVEATACDGSASCACDPGTECWSCTTLGGCGSGFATRLSRFGFTGSPSSETGAAGYFDGWAAVEGWITEDPCADPTEGHRFAVNGSGHNVVGTGSSYGSSCWSGFQFADYGSIGGAAIPLISSGVHRPESGSSFDFYATWYDGASDPSSISVVIDGTCYPMTIEIGAAGNRTYIYSGSVGSGCHEYYFLGRSASGTRATYPAMGSYEIGCGGSGYVSTQMPAGCEAIPCGDGFCDAAAGETCSNCGADCGACPPVCGDASCTGGETCSSCAADCGPCGAVCGDAVCDATETCGTCPADCGACGPCTDGAMQPCGTGACAGTQACAGGVWGACSGAAPVAEVCINGIDEDCNGIADDGCLAGDSGPMGGLDAGPMPGAPIVVSGGCLCRAAPARGAGASGAGGAAGGAGAGVALLLALANALRRKGGRLP